MGKWVTITFDNSHKLKIGQSVLHDNYGEGKIANIRPDHRIAHIEFNTGLVKDIRCDGYFKALFEEPSVKNRIRWWRHGKFENLKTFEQFNYSDIDPYSEEKWKDYEYKIMKYYNGDPPQNGYRYCLVFKDDCFVRDFNTLIYDHALLRSDYQNINEEDKEKLESSEYYITNGYGWGSKNFQKITVSDLRKIIDFEL